jgi:opacity protein-like surface antigen
MKKLILAAVSTLSIFSQVAQADVSTRVVDVVSGHCESVDGKYSAEVDGTTTLQTRFIVFDTGARADLMRVQMTEKVNQSVSELLSVDGEVDGFVYSISEDGKRLNVNYLDYEQKAHEVDMNCVTKVNARAMKSFTKQSR